MKIERTKKYQIARLRKRERHYARSNATSIYRIHTICFGICVVIEFVNISCSNLPRR